MKSDTWNLNHSLINYFIGMVLLAAIFRFSGVFDPGSLIIDEIIHVPAARSMLQYGTPVNDNWPHPPLGLLLVCGSIRIFGDNPYGWRMMPVIAGIASVIILFLLGRKLYPGSLTPLFAASFFALDPLHIIFSRTVMMEIPVILFFLLFCYFMLLYEEKERLSSLWYAGIALGLTVATKGAYFYAASFLIASYVFLKRFRGGTSLQKLTVDYLVLLVMLPATVYLLSFYMWFGRGYTFVEFIQFRLDALWKLRRLDEANFILGMMLKMGGAPWEWFIKPIMHAVDYQYEGVFGRFMIFINNPPVRLFVLPSVCYLFYYAWKTKKYDELLMPAIFFCNYAMFLLIRRPMFEYSSLVLLPFAYLSLARTFDLIVPRTAGKEYLELFLFCAIVVWGLYTFPLCTFMKVPLALYKPVLSITTFPELYR